MITSLLLAAAMAANAAPDDGKQPAPAAHAATQPKPDLSKIPAKNPFDPNRKVWEAPAVPPPPLPPLADSDIKLHGAIIAGSTRKAIVEVLNPRLQAPGQDTKGKAARPYRVLAVGDDVGGYRVADITPAEIVFEQGGRTTSLPFTITKGRGASGAAVPPPDQVAIVLPAPVPTIVSDTGAAVAATDPNAPPVAGAPAAQAQPAAPAQSDATAATTPVTPMPENGGQPADNSGGNTPSDPNATPPQGMSLLDAIMWAKTHNGQAAANPGTTK